MSEKNNNTKTTEVRVEPQPLQSSLYPLVFNKNTLPLALLHDYAFYLLDFFCIYFHMLDFSHPQINALFSCHIYELLTLP